MAVNLICVRGSSNLKLIYPIWNAMQCLRLLSKKKDSMENFISELTQRELNKWSELRREAINRNQSQSAAATVEIASSDEQHRLIDEIHDCLDTRDAVELERLIRRYLHDSAQLNNQQLILPRIVLLESLEFLCRTGSADCYKSLIAHLCARNADFFREHRTYFEILDLELEWKTTRGSVDDVLERFRRKYLEFSVRHSHSHVHSNEMDEGVQSRIKSHKSMLRKVCATMIDDTIASKGEAVARKLRETIEAVCGESRDYQLMFDLWRKLFESFWYSDQQIASELIVKHRILREKLVSKQLSFLCFIYLRNNNTENVNRLVQIFLQFNMMKQVETLVKILFEYECWRKNPTAVLQVVELCLKLDIALSDAENKKFLNLMLRRPDDEGRKKKKIIAIEKYQFKF